MGTNDTTGRSATADCSGAATRAYPVLGSLKTRASADIRSSPLSVGFETLDRRMFDPEQTYAHAARLGVKWARLQTGWARSETVRGRYDFTWIDAVVDNLLKIGIQPWFNLGYGNPLYTPTDDAAAVGWAPVFDDAALAGWLAFTERIAVHFKDRVTHWEIWNEPNIKPFWKPGEPDPARYAQLVAATAPVIRRQVPKAVIIGGAYSGVPLDYIRECLVNGMHRHIDKLAYHPYRTVPEQGYEADIRALRALLAECGAAHIGLWQGENGCPSQSGGAGALSDGDWNEARQAKWLLRRIVSDLRLGIELTSYFLMVDLVNYRGKINPKGLLRGADYTPKPAYDAYRNLCTLFDAETVAKPTTMRLEGVEAITAGFERHGTPLIAYWAPDDPTRDTATRMVRVILNAADRTRMTEPALLDPLDGTVYALPSLDHLPLTDYPLIIADARTFPIAPF